jgi:hypothetical protein
MRQIAAANCNHRNQNDYAHNLSLEMLITQIANHRQKVVLSIARHDPVKETGLA